jgi:hypothetical protein
MLGLKPASDGSILLGEIQGFCVLSANADAHWAPLVLI